MAQRRMMSLKVVDTDAFMDMPLSSQALYLHLLIRADDDGFVANPKKIMRMIGCQDDDIKILITKKFLLPFESGVCVIKHWKIHNLIRADRYTETQWVEEKSQLSIDGKTSKYSLSENVIPNGNQMAPQVRLGKVSIERDDNSLSLLDNPSEELISEMKKKFKCSDSEIKTKAASLADYCRSKGKKYKNYKSFLSNALRKDFGERKDKGKKPIIKVVEGKAKIIGYE